MPAQAIVVQMPQNLETLIAPRVAFLTEYQNAAYAKRYEDLVDEGARGRSGHRARAMR